MLQKTSLILLIGVFLGCTDTTTSSADTAKQVLRVATEGSYAPFNYTRADGTLAGFDVDIAYAICDKMNVQCQISPQDWDGIIPALKSGKYDAIIAAMSVTPERAKQVDFSTPYFANSLVFLANNESEFNPDEPGQIDQVSIAAQRSTISSQWLQETHPNASVRYYDTLNNAFLDLSAGRVQAMVSDKVPALDWLATPEAARFSLKGGEVDIDDRVAVAVNKGDEVLLAKINQALADMQADGTYDAIVQRNFGAN